MAAGSSSVRRIAVSALFLSIALVLNTFFSFYIPLFGQNGISVGVAGVFSMMPSLLFGPFYGAVVSGLFDLMGYVLKPAGAYMPLLTLTACLAGFLRGLCFRQLLRVSDKGMRVAVALFSLLLLALGLLNGLMLRADGVDGAYYQNVDPSQADTQGMHAISRLLITRTAAAKDPSSSLVTFVTSVTAGPLSCGALGLMLMLVDLIARRKIAQGGQVKVLAMLLAVVGSGLVITTLNTVILRETLYASWKVLPFVVLWIPRVIEEILMGAVKVCLMAVLIGVLNTRPQWRQLSN